MDIQEADAIIHKACGGDPSGGALPGWCTPDKGRRLIRIAATSGAKVGVELGVHGGRSLLALALGFKLVNKGRIDGIDSYSAADCLEGGQSEVDKQLWSSTDYKGLFDAAEGAIKSHSLQEVARLVVKRTQDAAQDYSDGSVDLIHLDGNHSKLVSCRDVSTWLPKMAGRAVWIADDVNWPSMTTALELLSDAGFVRTELGAEGYWAAFARGR